MKIYGWCVYCGVPAVKEARCKAPLTCDEHRTLVKRDPHYSEPDQWQPARAATCNAF